MPATPLDIRVDDAFFQPLTGLVASSPHLHPCPGYPDADWLRLGIQRVLGRVGSRRAFLQEHGLENAAEDRRRQERHREMEKEARRTGRPPTTLRTGLRRATQCSVQSIRWLRHALRDNLAEAAAVPRLAPLYASS